MSTITGDGKWESLSCKFDEWLPWKDDLDKKNVNDPSLNLSKQAIAEQVLHDIEDIGRNNNEDWLDEFPLFEEIQNLTPSEESDIGKEQKSGNHGLKYEQEQFSPSDGVVMSEIHKQPSIVPDLFSTSYENTAKFIFSKENILYINTEPFLSFAPFQPERLKIVGKEKIPLSETSVEISEDLSIQKDSYWSDLYDIPDVKNEMAVVEEIVRNTAVELDQWESESSRSETSSDGGVSGSDFSSKEKYEEETDDPDWKPEALPVRERKSHRKSKPYIRGGSQEEKKLRKKEQNKNAATRYRQKKKAEVCEILKEEESLKEKKAKLEEKVTDIQSEIKYLKALMRDLFKVKGIIN